MAALQTPTLIQPHEVVNGGVLKATPANARFDVALIAPHIQDAEHTHILPFLGQEMYRAMITAKAGRVSQYNADLSPVVTAFPFTPAYEALWTYILLRFCAWAVYYEALPYLAVSVGAAGIFQIESEHAKNVGSAGVRQLQDSTRRRLELMRENAKSYMCERKTSYPLWDSSVCPDACGQNEKSPVRRFGLHYVTSEKTNKSPQDDK